MAAEDLGQLHADGRQLVDVEEAAVVDFLGGDPPEGQPVGLPLDQAVQQVETARVAGRAVERPHRGVDGRRGRRDWRAQGGEAALDDFLLAVALGHLVGRQLGAGRQVAQGGQDAAQLAEVLVLLAELADQVGQRVLAGSAG